MIQLSPDSSLGSILGQGFGQGLGQGMQQAYGASQVQSAMQNLAQGLQQNPNASIQEKLMYAQQQLASLPPEQQQLGMNAILQQYQEQQKMGQEKTQWEREQQKLDLQHKYKVEEDRLKRKLDQDERNKLEAEEDQYTAAYTDLVDELDLEGMKSSDIRKAAIKKGLSAKLANRLADQVKGDIETNRKAIKDKDGEYKNAIAELTKLAKDAGDNGKRDEAAAYRKQANDLIKERSKVLKEMQSKFSKKPKDVDGIEAESERPVVAGIGKDYKLPVADPDTDEGLAAYDKTLKELFGERGAQMEYETMTAKEQSEFRDALKKNGYQLPPSMRDTYGKTTPENVRADYELQKAKLKAKNKREKEEWQKRQDENAIPDPSTWLNSLLQSFQYS